MSGPSATEAASETAGGSDAPVVIVLAGGTAPSQSQFEWARANAGTVLVVAADSGAEHARRLGATVDVAVGDFDSISPAARDWLDRIGTPVQRHRPDKDASDLELALVAASQHDPHRIVVLGVGGGRLDHLLFNLVVLADRRWARRVCAVAGEDLVTVIAGDAVLAGSPGSIVSLVPVGGPATVATTGLRYPLNGEELSPTSTRGLSNIVERPPARVTVASGVLLAIQPDHSFGVGT